MNPPLLERRLLVVTGKGGTGKTTVAAALARFAGRQGKSVLLCELDRSGDVGAPFGTSRVEFEPHEVEPGVFVMAMETEKALQEYLQLNLKVPFALRMGPFARAFDFVATAAPGIREILTMGKLCWDVKRDRYDLVIADAPSTGHVMSQLGSSDSIGDLVSVGPLVNQTAWMREMLRDPERTGVVVVTTPEETPVNETIELTDRLVVETQTPLAAIVVNRVLPELLMRDEVDVFAALEGSRELLRSRVAGDVDAVFDAAVLASSFRRTQVNHLERLHRALDGDVPVLYVPQSFGDGEPASVTEEAAVALAAEIQQ